MVDALKRMTEIASSLPAIFVTKDVGTGRIKPEWASKIKNAMVAAVMLKHSEQVLRNSLSCELFGTVSPFLQRIEEIGSQSDKYPPNNNIPNLLLASFNRSPNFDELSASSKLRDYLLSGGWKPQVP